jgi:carboxypeptidase C (cathepsin A)
LTDNSATWLDFTDLVFIDPVGTGFSYAQGNEDEAKKRFYDPKADVEYLSRITHFLQTRLGVAMTGMALVSRYLDPAASANDDLSPLPWLLTLPSIAAANQERQGKLNDAAMREIVAYTRTEHVPCPTIP